MGVRKSREQRFREVMGGQARGLGPALLRGLASLASPMYGAAVALRNRLYDRGWGVRHLPRPVISVGNITVGGTGKTVLVAEIARWLREVEGSRGPSGQRLNVAVLLRGYKGGQSPVGSDEAAMLRRLLPGVAVEADPDRVAAGRRLLAGPDPPDVFILDDGFQHRRLARCLDIVTVDATADLSGPLGRLLPRGLLREPLDALRRADFAVITRADQAPMAAARLAHRLAQINPGLRTLEARHRPTRLVGVSGSQPLEVLAGWRYLAFCGIGQPDAFAATLAGLGGQCVEFVAFDDHHVYAPGELAELARRAEAAGANALLTTEKDCVKLADASASPPVWALQVEIDWLSDTSVLRKAVLGAVGWA